MHLLVIRHGIAEERDHGTDEARALTPKGRRRMKRVAAALQRLVPSVDLLASSPLQRARETAEIVAEIRRLEPQIIEQLIPGAPLGQLLEWLAAQDSGTIAVVGHEDGLSTFVSWLISARPESHLVLKKGGAALLSVTGRIAPGAAMLEWLLTPRQLRDLA